VFAVASQFVLGQFKAYGIPPNRLFLKPHFVWPDSTERTGDGEFALFVGRLVEEKGVNLLRDAWTSLAVPLRIRGDGPELRQLQAAFDGRDHVSFVPHVPPLELASLFRRARFLVWPSLGLYETFGLVAAEAFARRIPVLAADAGAMADMVEDGVTGLQFRSGNAEDLRAKVAWAWDHPREMRMMGDRAFAVYEQRYSAQSGYARLMQLYETARQRETSSRS
jgi:glycosyltransferase involved in cell wall biosynthesis